MDVNTLDLLATGKIDVNDGFAETVIHLTLKEHGAQATAAKALTLARQLNPGKTLPMKVQEHLRTVFRSVAAVRDGRRMDINNRRLGFQGPPISARMLGLKVYRAAKNALHATKNQNLVTIGVTVQERLPDYSPVGHISIDVVEIHTPIKHYHFNVIIWGKPEMVGDRMRLTYYELDGTVSDRRPSRMKYQRNGFYGSRFEPGGKVSFDKLYTTSVNQPPNRVLYQHGTPMPKAYGTAPLNVLGA